MKYNPINEELDVKETLRCYFAGEFTRKAKLFKKKMGEKIPEELYYSIPALNLNKPYISKTNNISDPTAETVLKFIEIQEERKELYTYYSTLQNEITSIIDKLNVNDEDRIILYAYLGLSDSLTKSVKFTSYSYTKARTRIIRLLAQTEELLNKEMKGMINNDNSIYGDKRG